MLNYLGELRSFVRLEQENLDKNGCKWPQNQIRSRSSNPKIKVMFRDDFDAKVQDSHISCFILKTFWHTHQFTSFNFIWNKWNYQTKGKHRAHQVPNTIGIFIFIASSVLLLDRLQMVSWDGIMDVKERQNQISNFHIIYLLKAFPWSMI